MRFTLLLITLFSIGVLSGQNFHYGLKLGAGLSKVSTVTFDPNDPDIPLIPSEHNALPVFHGGLWGELELAPRWGFQTELLWQQQAWQSRDAKEAGQDGYIEFNYLSVPLLLSYELLPNLAIAAGPQLAYLLNYRIRKADDPRARNPLLNDETGWEFSANLEVSYRLKDFRCGLRAQRDLSAFLNLEYNDVNGEPFGTVGFHHQALQLWVAYAIQ
jgi:hypothetical protein